MHTRMDPLETSWGRETLAALPSLHLLRSRWSSDSRLRSRYASPPALFEVTLVLCEDLRAGREMLRLPLAFPCLNYAFPIKTIGEP